MSIFEKNDKYIATNATRGDSVLERRTMCDSIGAPMATASFDCSKSTRIQAGVTTVRNEMIGFFFFIIYALFVSHTHT